MQKIIGYWEVWHLVLAMILYMALYRFIDHKQLCTIIVMGVALLWEVAEYFWNLKAYKDKKHFILNSYKDMAMALIGSLACITLL
jgi:hypothetical protein